MTKMALWVGTIIMTWGFMTFRYVGNGFTWGCIAFIFLAGYLLWKEKKIPRVQIDSDLGKALLILYGTLFIVGALQFDDIRNLTSSSYGAFTLFGITLPLWMILFVGWNHDIRMPIFFTICGNMWAFCLYGLWMYVTQHQDRLAGFYGSPPEAGILSALILPFIIALSVYYWEKKWTRFITVPLIPLQAICCLLTETRGAYLACVAALFATVAVVLWKYRKVSAFKIKLLVCVMTLFVSAAMVAYVWDIGTESAKRMQGGDRLIIWESTYCMWEDNKLLGIGLSEWAEKYNTPESPYFRPEKTETTNVMPHSIYLYFLATGGIISFLALLGYMWFMCRFLLKSLWSYAKNPFAWAMFFSFVAFMANGVVDATLISKHIGRIFYLLLGVGILFVERWKHPEKR